MGVTVEGLDDLMSTINNLGDIGTKAGRKAIQEGSEIILETMKHEAPQSDGSSIKPSSGHGAEYLAIQYIKTTPSTVYGATGIGSKNWQQTKQFWFQHYGYFDYGLNFQGNPYVNNNVGWVWKAQNRCADKAQNKVISVLKKEIDEIW